MKSKILGNIFLYVYLSNSELIRSIIGSLSRVNFIFCIYCMHRHTNTPTLTLPCLLMVWCAYSGGFNSYDKYQSGQKICRNINAQTL